MTKERKGNGRCSRGILPRLQKRRTGLLVLLVHQHDGQDGAAPPNQTPPFGISGSG